MRGFVETWGLVGLLAVAGCSTIDRRPETDRPVTPVVAAQTIEYGVEQEMWLPGTWRYDLERGSRFGDPKSFDMFWQQSDSTHRTLVPKNGAQFAILEGLNFEDVTLNDLLSAQYSRRGFSADDNDDDNQLPPGTIIGIKTSQGNYAKLIVNKYTPLYPGREHDIGYKNYNLEATFVLYANPNK